MDLTKITQTDSYAIKFEAHKNGAIVGRVFLYVLKNDLHNKPFGLMEDLFVEESMRGNGLGGQLVEEVIQEAKKQGCYKLIGTSRHDRKKVHEWYKKFGFVDWGKEFRIDF